MMFDDKVTKSTQILLAYIMSQALLSGTRTPVYALETHCVFTRVFALPQLTPTVPAAGPAADLGYPALQQSQLEWGRRARAQRPRAAASRSRQ